MRRFFFFLLILTGSLASSDPNQNLARALESDNPIAIGNAYLALEELPWAVLYFRKALQEDPGNTDLQKTLNLTLAALPGSKTEWKAQTFTSLYFVFSLLVAATAVLGSLAIWLKNRRWPLFFALALAASLMVFAEAARRRYLTPIPAAIISSSPLYRTPAAEGGIVLPHPLFAGSVVGVIDFDADGEWLKVTTQEGTVGFIPMTAARILSSSIR